MAEVDETTIVEEHKLWRKNCRYMYTYISETALLWPSLSIQFLPAGLLTNKTADTETGVTRNIVLTTHTSGEDEAQPEYMKVASFQLPRDHLAGEKRTKRLTAEELEGINTRLKINAKYEQASEINRVRVNGAGIVGTINSQGEVYVYDLKGNSSHKLEHHTESGFGIDWSKLEKNSLITGAEDKSIALWDYTQSTSPLSTYAVHEDAINDVKWAVCNAHMWGSVGEDKKFVYGDDRTSTPAISRVLNQETSFNSLGFSNFSTNLVAFGGEDANVYLYDVRNMDSSLHVIMGHQQPITNVEWDPFHENVLGSSSLDRRVILWDLNKIGDEQLPDEAEDGAPELLMMHGGHTGGVNDFCFNPEVEWCLGSCSDDNIVHIWCVEEAAIKESPAELKWGALE